MISSDFSTIFYGLLASAGWGIGDFSGGVASKRLSAYTVVVVSQIIGVVMLAILALLTEPTLPPIDHLIWGLLAGVAGGFGLLNFYSALASTRMGLAAPVTAILAALIPVGVGMLIEGVPAAIQLAGFALALVAVWLTSTEGNGSRIQLSALRLPIAAGLGFGFFLVCLDQASEEAIFWPLVAARIASITVIAAVARMRGIGQKPQRNHIPWIAGAGIFDAVGNTFFALAASSGRLDVASIMSSLYPGVTVLLAWLILQEMLTRPQWTGVGISLLAIILISL
jgi:drug/metabolite transporter (DMT)-like permease